MSGNDNLKLAIATIKPRDLGHATNTTRTWAKIKERLARVSVDQEITVEQYNALDTVKKSEYKDKGSYVLGHFENQVRKREAIKFRTALSLDIDEVSQDVIDDIDMGLSYVCGFEFFATTTRSHMPEKPKWRMIFPVSKPIPAEMYPAVCRIFSSRLTSDIQESMDAVDDVSHRVAQVMFWPSRSSDGQFLTMENRGRLLDYEEILGSFPGWEDWSKLPYSEKRGQKRPGSSGPAEDPTAKRGLVGAFCRAYTITEALDRFIPGTYIDPRPERNTVRYKYAHGSGAKGAIVYNDMFLYSHHGTDPCGERNVNAFDLVRLHLFGKEDKRDDGSSPTKQPSWKRMEEFLEGDERVKRAFLDTTLDVAAMFDDLGGPAPMSTAIVPVNTAGQLDPGLKMPLEDRDDILDLLGELPEKPKEEVIDAQFDEILGTHNTNWMSDLDLTDKGDIRSNVANVGIILQNDPRFKSSIEFNDFTEEVVMRKPMALNHSTSVNTRIIDILNGDHWQDHHDHSIRTILEAQRGPGKVGYGLKVSDRDLTAGVEQAARKNKFHPVKDTWNSIKWDGVERVATLFIDYLGAEDNEYHREVATKMLVAMVTRIYEPGHKFDFMVILEGLQGIGKSTFLRTLSLGFFAEMGIAFEDTKRAVETMRGALIVEMPELTQFNKSEVNTIKAFMSSDFDKVRMAYGRREQIFKRKCIFAGSTNEATYLRDTTGNRRFWPVKTNLDSEVDIDRLKRLVPQIHAEAVTIYRSLREAQPFGTLPLYLRDAAREEAVRIQESRRVETDEDGRVGEIAAWLDRPMIVGQTGNALSDSFSELDGNGNEVPPTTAIRNVVCIREILSDCLNLDTNRISLRAETLIVSNALKRMKGWREFGKVVNKRWGEQRAYVRIGSDEEKSREIIRQRTAAKAEMERRKTRTRG